MKNITKIIVGAMFAFALILGGQAYAQEDSADTLRDRIADLRETHQDLKAQVDAGEITTEEARATWQALIAEVRAEKKAFFEAKMERVEAKYQELLETNPERAALLGEHLAAATERREATVAQRDELRAKVESGEITRQEARVIKVDFVKTQRDAFQQVRDNLKDKRQELRDTNQADRQDAIQNRLDNRPSTGAVRPGVRPVGTRPAATLPPVNVNAALTDIAGVVSDITDGQ